jgi:hypothetical protein
VAVRHGHVLAGGTILIYVGKKFYLLIECLFSEIMLLYIKE